MPPHDSPPVKARLTPKYTPTVLPQAPKTPGRTLREPAHTMDGRLSRPEAPANAGPVPRHHASVNGNRLSKVDQCLTGDRQCGAYASQTSQPSPPRAHARLSSLCRCLS